MAIKELHKMTHQFMSGIHGIYRVIGGALPVAIYFEFNRLGFAEGWQAITAFSLLVVFMSVVACYVLAKTAVYTAPREPYSKNMFLN